MTGKEAKLEEGKARDVGHRVVSGIKRKKKNPQMRKKVAGEEGRWGREMAQLEFNRGLVRVDRSGTTG